MYNNGKVELDMDNEEFYKIYGRKKLVALFTLGCKVNQYETEALAGIFEKAGYEIVEFEEEADVYVINTCTVTGLSDRKSRQIIRRARANNRDSVVAVTGCYSQTAPEEVLGIPGVNIVLGTGDRGKIINCVNKIKGPEDKLNGVEDIAKARRFEELKVTRYRDKTRAFLKIQEGCSQFCSYCIIPYARGPVRSRDPEAVLEEVRRLSRQGFKEIVLTGIHVASYGKDLKTTSLPDIISKVHEIDGIARIRLGSIEPTTVTPRFAELAVGLEKLCPHFHISLQSGCDETLKRMNRRYDTSRFREAVGMLRESIGDVSVTTDIMTGFPGETDYEFERTFEFLQEISFSRLHVFKYSARKGTPAASFQGQVPPEVKELRSNRLLELSRTCAKKFNSRFSGRVMPVLFEREVKGEKGVLEGLTPNYIRVLTRAGSGTSGDIKEVRLIEAVDEHMTGEMNFIGK